MNILEWKNKFIKKLVSLNILTSSQARAFEIFIIWQLWVLAIGIIDWLVSLLSWNDFDWKTLIIVFWLSIYTAIKAWLEKKAREAQAALEEAIANEKNNVE